MSEKAKRNFKAELILDITVKELKNGTQYQGQIKGCGISPLKFELIFNIPLEMLEFYAEIGEACQTPRQKIAAVLNQALKNRYNLKITKEDDKSINIPPEELGMTLFIPITMAIGLLRGKSRISEATFHIPWLVAEEMEQFQNPIELQKYVLSLNK